MDRLPGFAAGGIIPGPSRLVARLGCLIPRRQVHLTDADLDRLAGLVSERIQLPEPGQPIPAKGGHLVPAPLRTVVKDRDTADALADEYRWAGFNVDVEALPNGKYVVKVRRR